MCSKFKDYVFTLEPEKIIKDRIKNIKKNLFREYGYQRYLLHPPHITIYLAKIEEIKKDDFYEFAKKIKSLYSPIEIEIKNIDLFKKDPLTNLKTFYFEIGDKKEKLKKIQRDLWNFLKNYKRGGYHKIYEKNIYKIPYNLKKNIEKYDYSFFGKIWKPHISIGSFDKDISKKLQDMEKKIPFGFYKINEFCIYEYLNDKNMKVLYKFKILKQKEYK